MLRSPLALRFFWVSSPVVQVAVAVVMVRRRLHRAFPMFFSYTVFRASTALLMFFLFQRHWLAASSYVYTNWVHEVGCIILRFAIIYELFGILLAPYSVLRESAASFFRWGAAGLVVVAVMIAVYHQWGPYSTPLAAGLNLVDRTADIVQCGLLVALLLFSEYLQVPKRSYAFGIVLGLGIFASVDLATAAILMESLKVPAAQQLFIAAVMNLVGMATYLLCASVWLLYALLPEPAPQMAGQLPEHDLDSWNHELQRLLHR